MDQKVVCHHVEVDAAEIELEQAGGLVASISRETFVAPGSSIRKPVVTEGTMYWLTHHDTRLLMIT